MCCQVIGELLIASSAYCHHLRSEVILTEWECFTNTTQTCLNSLTQISWSSAFNSQVCHVNFSHNTAVDSKSCASILFIAFNTDQVFNLSLVLCFLHNWMSHPLPVKPIKKQIAENQLCLAHAFQYIHFCFTAVFFSAQQENWRSLCLLWSSGQPPLYPQELQSGRGN